MRTTSVIFLSLFITSSTYSIKLYAQDISNEVIYNPSIAKIGTYILSSDSYEDIRIDSDLDGKIDFWHIKKENLQIDVRFSGSSDAILLIKKFGVSSVDEAIFKLNQGKLHLVARKQRSPHVMNGQENSCEDLTKNVLNEISGLSDVVSAEGIAKNTSLYLDQSCKSENTPAVVSTSIRKLLKTNSKSSSFSQCLASDDLSKQFKDKNAKLGLDYLSAKMLLDLKKLALGDKSANGIFQCKLSDDSDKPSAKYVENGKIIFSVPKNATSDSVNLEPLIYHELLHRAGLDDEQTMKTIIAHCTSSADEKSTNTKGNGTFNVVDPAKVGDKLSESSTPDAKSETATAVNKKGKPIGRNVASEDSGDGVDLKSEIANAKTIPSAEKLAQTKTDKSPEGIAAAVKDSQATSAPVLRMANQVMGVSNTPANAEDDSGTSTASYSSGGGGGSSSGSATRSISSVSAPTTYDSSSSSRSSDSDSSSSKERYQSRHDRYQSGSINAGASTGGLAKGERVVEEIDLTKGTNYKASAGSGATNTRQVTQTQAQSEAQSSATKTASAARGPASTTATPTRAAMGGDVSAGASSGGGSGGSGRSLGSNSTAQALGTLNSDGTGNTNRKAGNNSRSPASTTTSSSRDEIVTFLSNGDYTRTKNKLRDANFVSNLKENKIKILDLYGGQVGADKADVIFLDQGDKFSRQK